MKNLDKLSMTVFGHLTKEISPTDLYLALIYGGAEFLLVSGTYISYCQRNKGIIIKEEN